MKKQIIILMLAFFLVGFVTANAIGNGITIKNTFEEAKDIIDSELEKKKQYKDNLKINYKYSSDKVCEFDYLVNDYLCSICYEMTLPVNDSRCIILEMNSTKESDDSHILNSIKEILSRDFEMEMVGVKVRDENGREFK